MKTLLYLAALMYSCSCIYYVCMYSFMLIYLSTSYKITIPENMINHCLRITTIKYQRHTILLDMENETNTMLKDCLLKNIHENQSLLLLKGGINNSPKKEITSSQPNVVIITKELSYEFSNKSSVTEVIKSHSNLLYIISTDKTKFVCINGTFNKPILRYVQNFLNNLWQKHQIIRVVLTFPYTCPDVYVIYDGKKLKESELFDRTIKLLKPRTFDQLSAAIINSGKGLTEGYPLKASIFHRFPTSILLCNKINQYIKWNKNITNGFCGLDGLVLQDTVSYFNFKVIFPKYEDCTRFGYMDYNTRVITGSLGCVLKRKIDISFNSRFMVLYATDIFNYLHYITHDSLCVLLARPDPVPLWYYPYHTYSFCSSILITITVIALCIVSRLSNFVKNQDSSKLHKQVFDYITCILFGVSIRKHSKFYLLRGIALASSIIILAIYQGHINYSFTTLVRYKQMRTLKQLYSSNNILYTTVSVRELLKPFKYSNDEVHCNFFKSIKLVNHSDFNIVLKNKNVVTLGRKLDANLEIMLKHTDENGNPLIYVLEDCFRTYFLSYITRAGFPFVKDLKIFMERLLQAGLPKMYYRWTQSTLNIPEALPKYRPEPRPTKKLTMRDQRVAFSMLLTGYIISSVVFIAENWIAMKNKHKN